MTKEWALKPERLLELNLSVTFGIFSLFFGLYCSPNNLIASSSLVHK